MTNEEQLAALADACKAHEVRLNETDRRLDALEKEHAVITAPGSLARLATWLKLHRPPVRELVLWTVVAAMGAFLLVNNINCENDGRPPHDPFAAAVHAAWVKDGKPAQVSQLAALYRNFSPIVANAVTSGEALAKSHDAAQSLISDAMPATRRAIADELNKVIGTEDVPLDAVSRAKITSQFVRTQKVLEGVK